MSVINKMLRDLDQQAASGAAAASSRAAPAEIMRGTMSVSGLAVTPLAPAPGSRDVPVVMLLLIAATVLATVWFWPRAAVLSPVVPAAVVVAPDAQPAALGQVTIASTVVLESPPPVATPLAVASVVAVEPPRQAALHVLHHPFRSRPVQWRDPLRHRQNAPC